MKMTLLDSSNEDAYRQFLADQDTSLVYHSLGYREVIREVAGGIPEYHLAIDNSGAIRAALPLFRKEGPSGTVYNSLPFFGSNGGPIGCDGTAINLLFNHYNELISGDSVASATLIESPFNPIEASAIKHNMQDHRIGQITPLPRSDGTEEALMSILHQKTRNMVRKAQKSGVLVSIDNGAFPFLRQTHKENMSVIGGQQKSPAFFSAVRDNLAEGTEWQIYIAQWEGQVISACLFLYHNRTVEYFVPVVKEAFRNMQPLSLIIFEAMLDAASLGFRWWNWGGTWVSQDGVHRFKKRWGTIEKPYRYFVSLNRRNILDSPVDEILASYASYYVVPFAQLTSPPHSVRPIRPSEDSI